MLIFRLFGAGYSSLEVLFAVVAFLLAITIALVLHEFAHAVVALWWGDPTAKLAKRVSLNPARHVEPLGLVFFLLIGFGWAKPVPVNPFNFKNYRWGNFWVSVSGVIVNAILAFVFSFGFFMMITFAPLNLWTFGVAYFFGFGLLINIAVALFNMLPIPPLDGFNMLASFAKPNNRFMNGMRQSGFIILILFMLLGGTTMLFWVNDFIQDALVSFWGWIFRV